MTKKEAIALEALCEKYISKALDEKVEIAMTINGNLKVTFGENSVSFYEDLSTPKFISFWGFVSDLKEAIDNIIKCIDENREDFELLLWSYQNRNALEGEEK